MPPVMGAGVFIMSEVTGISYFEIIKAAAIPAILYYVGLMAMVHFLALRYGMQPVPRSELPSWGPVLRRAYFVIPFGLIVYLLAEGLLADRRRLLHDRRDLRAVLPRPEDVDDAAPVLGGARSRPRSPPRPSRWRWPARA